jgi:type II secretory pathway pseudopilin PulG
MTVVMRILKRQKIKWGCNRGESGMTMLEALVSIGILGGVVITMVLAMSGGALAVAENSQEVSVQNLARTQMEYIKSCPYIIGATSYAAVDMPEGFSISVGVSSVPGTGTNIQKVTANISRDGNFLMAVTDYKVNR